MEKQKGFTLIELIMVVVILGILVAAALPKFIDLSADAKSAAASAVAGAIATSASIRKAASTLNAASHSYATSRACAGAYLEGGASSIPAACAKPVLANKSCAVTCNGVTETVTLP